MREYESNSLVVVKVLLINILHHKLIKLFPVTGTLKGYDQLLNLVLDEVEEQINGTASSVPAYSADGDR
jgi:hypothetical protein